MKAAIRSVLQRDRKKLAVLIDPDKASPRHLHRITEHSLLAGVDCFLVGGSLITNGKMAETVTFLKESAKLPVLLFPGHPTQICKEADAMLLLSLISGRNPELLIGHHVTAAPLLKSSGLDILPTGYMLIEGGNSTSVLYMSNTQPIPYDKPDIAMCTAMAGEMLGLQHIYLETGSGALKSVHPEMIEKVRSAVNAFVWVGGGIRTPEAAQQIAFAGADIIVVGTAAEKDAGMLQDIGVAVKSVQPVIS